MKKSDFQAALRPILINAVEGLINNNGKFPPNWREIYEKQQGISFSMGIEDTIDDLIEAVENLVFVSMDGDVYAREANNIHWPDKLG